MAKESMKAREVKRAKMVAKYAAKRAALKEIVITAMIPKLLSKLLKSSNAFLATLTPSVCTTVARLRVVLRVTSASSVSLVFNSVRWLLQVLSLAFAKHLGKMHFSIENN